MRVHNRCIAGILCVVLTLCMIGCADTNNDPTMDGITSQPSSTTDSSTTVSTETGMPSQTTEDTTASLESTSTSEVTSSSVITSANSTTKTKDSVTTGGSKSVTTKKKTTTVTSSSKKVTTKKKTTTIGTTKRTAPTTNVSTSVATTTHPRPQGPQGNQSFTNLTYDNAGGFMGDNDGPAYCVYSKWGYNQATIDVLLKDVEVQNFRKDDTGFIAAYIFLGMNIRHSGGGNNLDAGLKYDEHQKWHLFYSLSSASEGQSRWYESRIMLDPTHDYRLTLDCAKYNGWAEITVYDLTFQEQVDYVLFQSRNSLKTGENVSFYQDYALDFPPALKLDQNGNPTEDWQDITLYNTNQGLYMKNINIVNATLNQKPWTADKTDRRVIWPDKNLTKIDYPVVQMSKAGYDTEISLSLDMNR